MQSEVQGEIAHQDNYVERPDRVLDKGCAIAFGLLVLFLLIFPHRQAIELWDESHYLDNAFEMALRGHWLTPTYNWVPDHWYSKPPLFVWSAALLMRLHLPPLVALRLPAALAALALLAVVFFFCRIFLQRPLTGVFSALLLSAAHMFWWPHMALTGDMDEMLCLWMAIYSLGFWIYVENARGQARFGLLASGAGLALAILTKGIAGVLALPGLLLFLVLRRQVQRVFRDRSFWIALLVPFAIGAAYYLLRERSDPGYIQNVWWNELAGRFGQVNEGHAEGTFFYFYRLLLTFEPGVLLVPLGVVALFKRPPLRSVLLLTGVTSLVLLLVLTKSATKINYYCAPVLPLTAIFSAVGLHEALIWLSRKRPGFNMLLLQRAAAAALALATVVILARLTVKANERKNARTADDQYGDSYGIMLNDMARHGISGPVFILDNGAPNDSGIQFYNPIPEFYAKYATAHSRLSVSVHRPTAPVPAGSWVLTCDPKTAAMLQPGRLAAQSQGPGACIYGRISSQ